MSASMLVPMDEGQGVSREPLSVVEIHQDSDGLWRAKVFYQMMEEEFGDDFCFDCVYWPKEALADHLPAVMQDASEADLILLALGQGRATPFVDEMSGWLRRVRDARHAPFSLVCLTDDPLLATGRIHADFQGLAGHFSMVYVARSIGETTRSTQEHKRFGTSALSPVLFDRLIRIDPHHTGGIND